MVGMGRCCPETYNEMEGLGVKIFINICGNIPDGIRSKGVTHLRERFNKTSPKMMESSEGNIALQSVLHLFGKRPRYLPPPHSSARPIPPQAEHNFVQGSSLKLRQTLKELLSRSFLITLFPESEQTYKQGPGWSSAVSTTSEDNLEHHRQIFTMIYSL